MIFISNDGAITPELWEERSPRLSRAQQVSLLQLQTEPYIYKHDTWNQGGTAGKQKSFTQ